jgi:hypothetical protein
MRVVRNFKVDGRYAAAPMVPNTGTQCSWVKGNRSVYLWDAGMFKACKESRDVLLKYYLRWRNSSFPSRRLMYVEGEHPKGRFPLMVRPYGDLFFLNDARYDRTPDPNPLAWPGYRRPHPMFRNGDHPPWVDRFSPSVISNFAFEFDPTWNNSLRHDGEDIKASRSRWRLEWTPRGWMARVVLCTGQESLFLVGGPQYPSAEETSRGGQGPSLVL